MLAQLGGDVVVNLVVKNTGNKTVFIDVAGIDFEGEMMYQNINHLHMFPKELRSEESVVFEFNAIDVVKKLESVGHANQRNIVAIVVDKLGRKYKSKSYKIKFGEIRTLQSVMDKNKFS